MNSSFLSHVARSWWVLALYGAVAILFGIYLLAWPGASVVALTWAYGVVALAEGVLSLAALFDKSVQISRAWLVLYALASILFGVLAIAQPLQMAGVMLLLLAAWLIVGGVFRIVFAIRVRKAISNEWLLILSGVLAILLGVLFAMYPAAGLLTVVLWIGAGALIYGVLQVVAAFRLRSLR
ncbi:HdeD family acid-resistance protein [Dokdonella sp.]|uniref:HdeD family acid-resistance protein n=1 Tax=Dokdonella sp. TaxID=2291710 RepID=UPI0026160CE9|nr:HdeD family acid-resistance protein [Dokdonella sp.]